MCAAAARWTCARCEVSVGRLDGSPTEAPASWTQSRGGRFCLSCSRALAAATAIDSASPDSSRSERVRIGRKALIEFEIHRSPDAPDRAIALACRTSSGAVASIRKGMDPVEPQGSRHPAAAGGG